MPKSLLERIAEKCKVDVSVHINQHRSYRETAARWIEKMESCGSAIAPEVRAEMIARDTTVWVQAYPDTPIGFYACFHWDLDTALMQVLHAIETNAPK